MEYIINGLINFLINKQVMEFMTQRIYYLSYSLIQQIKILNCDRKNHMN